MSNAAYSDEDLQDFLESLDNSDVTPTDWEIKFIETNLDAIAFSPRQRQRAIDPS